MTTIDAKTEDEHRRQVIGARRRNNIYGETSDYIMMAFLCAGGDGGIYRPAAAPNNGPAIIYGRSATTMYIIAIMQDPSNTIPSVLTATSTAIDAIPVVAVPNDQLKRVKFYNTDGSRLRHFT